MKPTVLLRDPDRVLLSTLVGKAHTGIDLMTVRIGNLLPHLNRPPNSSNSLGDSSVGVIPGDVEGDRVLTCVSPNRSHTSHINDNYWVGPTDIHVKPVQLDPKFQFKVMSEVQMPQSSETIIDSVVSKTLSLWDVCYPVLNHVPTVHSHGPPQKKGVSPGQCLVKIKHVKGVSCVSPCLSVPTGQNVGGRLQQFWHIWQEMGANPRVVSVLRDGYTLPFKQRPLLTRFPLVQSGYANPTKSWFLKEALVSLREKLVVEKVVVKSFTTDSS